jgi:hypothetical protein
MLRGALALVFRDGGTHGAASHSFVARLLALLTPARQVRGTASMI